MQWFGDEADRHINEKIVRIIKAACIVVTRRAKQLLSVPGTGVRVKAGLTKKAALAKKVRVRRKVARMLNRSQKFKRAVFKKLGKKAAKRTFRVTNSGKITSKKKPKRKK
jgi:hypothetical protein